MLDGGVETVARVEVLQFQLVHKCVQDFKLAPGEPTEVESSKVLSAFLSWPEYYTLFRSPEADLTFRSRMPEKVVEVVKFLTEVIEGFWRPTFRACLTNYPKAGFEERLRYPPILNRIMAVVAVWRETAGAPAGTLNTPAQPPQENLPPHGESDAPVAEEAIMETPRQIHIKQEAIKTWDSLIKAAIDPCDIAIMRDMISDKIAFSTKLEKGMGDLGVPVRLHWVDAASHADSSESWLQKHNAWSRKPGVDDSWFARPTTFAGQVADPTTDKLGVPGNSLRKLEKDVQKLSKGKQYVQEECLEMLYRPADLKKRCNHDPNFETGGRKKLKTELTPPSYKTWGGVCDEKVFMSNFCGEPINQPERPRMRLSTPGYDTTALSTIVGVPMLDPDDVEDWVWVSGADR